ncbi:putative inorganic carbon transporter subunit DabA [Thiocapsa sp.]|uniref:putative inorganic carbon transporter subunit DabA n=1 Tax=Thiocapsa sp. TaxID=2024551 RepID=UPI0025DCBE1D|nr:putative inorganic carbon transporter subunit DabA [Thiocapsa sp.]
MTRTNGEAAPSINPTTLDTTQRTTVTPTGPDLGRTLKIRSMVTVAGEFLPFMWPMRNFIHHNPLNGFEHLPFEEAVELATRLFHARGYLRRTDYQALMREGRIDPDIIEDLVSEFLKDWVPRHDASEDDGEGLDLGRILVTLMTRMDQPSVGNAYPSTEAILARLRPSADQP